MGLGTVLSRGERGVGTFMEPDAFKVHVQGLRRANSGDRASYTWTRLAAQGSSSAQSDKWHREDCFGSSWAAGEECRALACEAFPAWTQSVFIDALQTPECCPLPGTI